MVDPAHIHAMIGRKTSKSGRASVREEEAGPFSCCFLPCYLDILDVFEHLGRVLGINRCENVSVMALRTTRTCWMTLYHQPEASHTVTASVSCRRQ